MRLGKKKRKFSPGKNFRLYGSYLVTLFTGASGETDDDQEPTEGE